MNEAAFTKQIAQNALSGAYLLYGDEPYTCNEAVRRAVETVDEGMRALNVSRLRAVSAAEIMNACETLPFFAKRRVVIAEEFDKDTADALAAYAEKAPDSCALLLLFPGKPNAQSALWKSMQKLDRAVEFKPFDPKNDTAEARAFIEECARDCGSTIEPGASRLLLEWVGYDQGTLQTTAVRLCDYAGRGNRVTAEDVRACIPPSIEHTVFEILDRLVAGNRKGAVTACMTLLHDGRDTSMRLASFMSGQLKQMLLARQLLDAGKSDTSAAQALGGSPYAAKLAVQKAKKCTLPEIVTAMTAFADIDWRQKAGEMKDDDALLLALMNSFDKGETT